MVVGAQIVLALQTLVARRVDPLDSAVLSTCQFHAGTATNVIPDEAVLRGTIRTLKTRDPRGDAPHGGRGVPAGGARRTGPRRS